MGLFARILPPNIEATVTLVELNDSAAREGLVMCHPEKGEWKIALLDPLRIPRHWRRLRVRSRPSA